MSEIGEEEEKVVEIKLIPGKKFFLSHLNSFAGKTLLKELTNTGKVKDPIEEHSFVGTLFKD